MADQPQIRDERTYAVVGTASRYAYMVLALGVMIDVVIRGLARNEAAWDLLGLVFVSSMLGTAYQRAKNVKVLSRRLVLMSILIAAVVGLATAMGLVLLMRRHR